jgi:hypothetical protein
MQPIQASGLKLELPTIWGIISTLERISIPEIKGIS